MRKTLSVLAGIGVGLCFSNMVTYGEDFKLWQESFYTSIEDDYTWRYEEHQKAHGFVEHIATVKARTAPLSALDNCISDKEWACRALEISGNNKDFFLTLSVESGGTFDPWKRSEVPVGNTTEPSFGFCQIHAGYHPIVYVGGHAYDWYRGDNDIRNNPEAMMQWCWEKYTICYIKWDRCLWSMYGYNVRHIHSKLYNL